MAVSVYLCFCFSVEPNPRSSIYGYKMSKASEGDDHLLNNENDPFDSGEGIIFKRLIDMMRWHPRLRKDQLPTWMHDYCVVCTPPGNMVIHWVIRYTFSTMSSLRMGLIACVYCAILKKG